MSQPLIDEFKSSPAHVHAHGATPASDGSLTLEDVKSGLSRALRDASIVIGGCTAVVGKFGYALATNIGIVLPSALVGMAGSSAAAHAVGAGFVGQIAAATAGVAIGPMAVAAVPLAIGVAGAALMAAGGLRKDDLGNEASSLLREMGADWRIRADLLEMAARGIEGWRERTAQAHANGITEKQAALRSKNDVPSALSVTEENANGPRF